MPRILKLKKFDFQIARKVETKIKLQKDFWPHCWVWLGN